MIPKGWQRSTLGEIARITSGGTPSRAEPSYWGGEVPWVTTGEIQFNIITESVEKITEAGLKNSSAKLVPAGTLLMAMYGQGKTRGQIAKLAIAASTNQNSAAILLNEGHEPDFFFHYLSSQYEKLREFGHSGGISHLNAGILKQVYVPVPPLAEQRRIACILSTWDQAIDITERLLANSRKQKQALTRNLLLMPAQQEQWPRISINTITERIQRRSTDGDNKLPVLMISSGSGFVRQDEKYGRFMAGKSVENYVWLKKGEFAYNKGNSKLYEFGCVFPLINHEEGVVPHVYVCFRFNDQCHPMFYEHLFAADFLHDQLGALVNTGVRNNGLLNIRPNDFFGCAVPLPSMKEQVRISNVLHEANEWIGRQEKILEALKQEKAALMAQLLTGKRRVHLPEPELERAA